MLNGQGMTAAFRSTRYQDVTNWFRLCVEIDCGQLEVKDHKTHFLTLPTSFLAAGLVVGVSENCSDFCFNWRLARNTDNIGLLPHFGTVSSGFSRNLYIGTVPLSFNHNNNNSHEEDDAAGVGKTGSRNGVGNSSYVPFFAGRAQILSGVIHLLRDLSGAAVENYDGVKETVRIYRKLVSTVDTDVSNIGAIYQFHDQSVVLIMAIPSIFSAADLIQFMGRENIERIERIRLLRDAAPNRYMAIVKFDSDASARNFRISYDGRSFSPLEPEICHIVHVNSVEFTTKAAVLEPLFDESDFITASTCNEAGETSSSLQSANFIEIPTCPVCLERIDSSATGIMIVICQHKFHCRCLERWGDGSCPVCRFSLHNSSSSASGGGRTHCSECGSAENIWLCLICGSPGCGRYDEGHANDHYCSTGHSFALELGTHRVWDYNGDNYVHRLIQTKEDGKLVEIPGPADPKPDKALKIETDPDYYSSMLVAQLESQRMFYEERIDSIQMALFDRLDRLNKEHIAELRKLSSELQMSRLELETLENQFMRDKQQLAGDIDCLSKENLGLVAELESERAMSDQAAKSINHYNEITRQREMEIEALNEQLRDLMIHIESQEQVRLVPDSEVTGGSVFLKQSSKNHTRKHNR